MTIKMAAFTLLFEFLLFSCLFVPVRPRNACPCADPNLCKPIQQNVSREVFAFSVDPKNWKMYDWNRLTTVVLANYYDEQLLCFAHSKLVKVSYLANFPTANLTNVDDRQRWVASQVDYIRSHYLDGINVDFEDEIPKSAVNLRDGLTALMKELVTEVKLVFPFAQITFDYGWSPDCIDSRCYDYLRISQLVDFVFIMSYDERSQIFGPCIAWANSAYNTTSAGLQQFMKQGIPPEKLVLGVPWYGYRYPCTRFSKQEDTCEIPKVPFRGVNCSDAAGSQINYNIIVDLLLPSASGGRKWDPVAKSPYFSYVSHDTGQWYQVWYDDADSLTIKYGIVLDSKLRGVGMWNADALDYSGTEHGRKMRDLIWGTLPLRV